MSGDTGTYRLDELRQRGIAFLDKPFRLEELVNVARLVTQGVPAGLERAGGTRHQ
jgi:hypothetical protein